MLFLKDSVMAKSVIIVTCCGDEINEKLLLNLAAGLPGLKGQGVYP
jgi:hypothetical protein